LVERLRHLLTGRLTMNLKVLWFRPRLIHTLLHGSALLALLLSQLVNPGLLLLLLQPKVLVAKKKERKVAKAANRSKVRKVAKKARNKRKSMWTIFSATTMMALTLKQQKRLQLLPKNKHRRRKRRWSLLCPSSCSR